MYNHPPAGASICWAWCWTGWSTRAAWPGMEKIKHGKAQMLYDVLDDSRLFTCAAETAPAGYERDLPLRHLRSWTPSSSQGAEGGLTNLKGPPDRGRHAASIYNAMPVEGVEKLCDFIQSSTKKIKTLFLGSQFSGLRKEMLSLCTMLRR